MLFAAAFFSYSETAAAIFIIGCNYSIKVYFFQTKFTLCRQFAYISRPSHPQRQTSADFLRKVFFPVAR